MARKPSVILTVQEAKKATKAANARVKNLVRSKTQSIKGFDRELKVAQKEQDKAGALLLKAQTKKA